MQDTNTNLCKPNNRQEETSQYWKDNSDRIWDFFADEEDEAQLAIILPKKAKEKEEAKKISERLEDPANTTGNFIADFMQKVQTDAYKPYSTELPFFDNLLGGGVIRQSLLLLLAAPSAGKTTLAQQIAEAMARHGKPVLYLNLEMSKEQMLAKAISCRLAKKDNGNVLTALDILQGYKWDTGTAERVQKELESYMQDTAPNIEYNPGNVGADLENITAMLHTIGEKAKTDNSQAPALFVDYLHLITSKKYSEPQEIIKAALASFKEYAIQYNTFVFIIIATNRASNQSGQYTIDSGRDSSALEYTGDYMLALNYTEIDNGIIKPTDEAALSELKAGKWRDMTLRVLKHRLGLPGISARMWYRPAGNIFYDAADFLPVDADRDKIAEKAAQRKRTAKG